MDFTEDEERKFSLEPGDLLVCEGGEPGRAAVWNGEISRCCYQKALHRLRPKDAQIDPHFLMHRLMLGSFAGEFTNSHAKTTIAHLPAVRLAALTVAVPSLSEQERIVAVLNEQMAAVEKARAASIEMLDAARSLYDMHLQRIFREENTQGWGVRRIDQLVSNENAITDGPFGSNLKTEHYTGSGARVVRLQNIGRSEFLDADKAYVSIEHFANFQKHAVRAGDIVIAALGDGPRPAGRACLVPVNFGPGLVKADCFRVRLNRDVALPEFIAAFLNSPGTLRNVSAAMRGATRPRVTLAMLRSTPILLPPLAKQQSIITMLSRAFDESQALVKHARASVSDFSALPAAFLRRAFSGQL